MRWTAVALTALVACGGSDFNFVASPSGADELALVLWIDAAGEPISGVAIWRPGDALRLTPPPNEDARLVAFVYPNNLLAPDAAAIDDCLVLGGTGPALPPPNGIFLVEPGRPGFQPAAVSPVSVELRFSETCEAMDCPAVVMQRFDLDDLVPTGLAVHSADVVTLAAQRRSDDQSRFVRIEQGELTDLGPVEEPARLSELQPLPDGGLVGKGGRGDNVPSTLDWYDVGLRYVRSSTIAGITFVSVGRDGYGIVSAQRGAWEIDGDQLLPLPEVGTDKVPGVAVHSRSRWVIRTRQALYVPDQEGRPRFETSLSPFEGVSRLGIDEDFLGWVGDLELVRERIDGATVERPRPVGEGNRLHVIEGLGGGNYLVAGESSIATRWRGSHWCDLDMGAVNTSFRISGRADKVIWLVGRQDDMGVDNVIFRIEFSR